MKSSNASNVLIVSLKVQSKLRPLVIPLGISPFGLRFRLVVRTFAICAVTCVLGIHKFVSDIIISVMMNGIVQSCASTNADCIIFLLYTSVL